MCTHPHVQYTAQAELDNVIGSERLPSIADRARLPYIDALVKEVLRWAPVVPLGELSTMSFLDVCSRLTCDVPPILLIGVPHRVMQDDVYEGYRIPAGSIVIANIWCVSTRTIITHCRAHTFMHTFFSTNQGDAARLRGIPRPTHIPTRALLGRGKG
jgi:Cytochrome P450